ncbi:MAG: YbdK family carboxylate-amine ligase [Oligoflexales bacterium]
MFHLNFPQNTNLGLGVEVEIQLIDPLTGDLKPVAPNILETLKAETDAKHIKSELFQSMLELDTPICKNAFEVGESLRKSLATARRAAGVHNALLMMSGTHPFANYAERLLTPSSRYHSLLDRNQWIARRLQIFGLHVHIGMRNGDHAIAMNNALCHYLPVVLALSASSPFWHGEETGLASCRITFFEAIPTGGHPYLLKNWEEFEMLVGRLVASKSIHSIKDLWWDIRPNIDYGTLEVRIADCPPTIAEVEAIVAFIHALALFIDGELAAGRKFLPPPEWILRENKWRASRHGVQCDLIVDNDGTSIPFLQVLGMMRDSSEKVLRILGYEGFWSFLEAIALKGPSYVRQRSQSSNGFDAIVRHLVRENDADQPEWE